MVTEGRWPAIKEKQELQAFLVPCCPHWHNQSRLGSFSSILTSATAFLDVLMHLLVHGSGLDSRNLARYPRYTSRISCRRWSQRPRLVRRFQKSQTFNRAGKEAKKDSDVSRNMNRQPKHLPPLRSLPSDEPPLYTMTPMSKYMYRRNANATISR